MSWILLTNDDGVDSPALEPFARALSALGTVRVVVPDRERSWVGKAITRLESIRVEKVDLGDGIAWICTGFPADAVQIGIHELFDEPPSLVVSGINVGYNHGTAFLLSSGTIGAAVEGWVSGVPSMAVSTGATGDWSTWKRKAHEPEALVEWERLAVVATSLVDEARGSGLLELADVVSINLPFDTTLDTPRRVTTVARVGYDRLFKDHGDGTYTYDFGGGIIEFDGIDGSDLATARKGQVSITPLRMPSESVIPHEVRTRLER